MRKARARRAQKLRTSTSLAAFVIAAALLPLHAQAQQHDETKDDRLWANEIFYEGTPRRFRARGDVHLRVHRGDGRILILTESLDYDGTKGTVRAQGGSFGKGDTRKTQGALRLGSGEVIFFQRLETDDSLTPLKGEGLGWRGADRHGGLSAATFRRDTRKRHEEDDWIFDDIRYTRCPVCADALAKREQRSKDGKEVAQQEPSRTFPPLWRIDATRMRWERFEGKRQGWFDDVPRIHLRHPRLNLYGVPVFYAPYLSFPRDGVRASGLLAPRYGQNSQRGWYVALPLYWAPHRGWDVTYLPLFTTENKDASRFETRVAWGAGGTEATKEDDEKSAEQGTSANKTVGHLFDATAGWSLPHSPIGSGNEAQFFAYAKARWRAPWGLRADAVYHGLGDRRYLHDYGQGASLFSTSAPSRLTDHARIEHFSRNGYARLTFSEQRELLAIPRADVRLLPEIVYDNGGVFARSRRGGGSWKIEGLWRTTAQDAQQAIDTSLGADIEEQAAVRQNLLSAATSLGWRQNLPFSFASQSTLRVATTYWHDTQEGNFFVPVPEFQQSVDGLFAKTFKKNKRILYLRPMVEFYATLDDNREMLRDKLQDKLGGKATFYETGARLGDRLAFDSALDSGQRLLVAAELGVKGENASALSLFVAPTLLRKKDEPLSGRLWTGARASWKDRILFEYDTTWLLPKMQPLSQHAKAEVKEEVFALSLAYKEFRSFDSTSTALYEQDITVKGDLRLQRWQLDLSAGYGFLGHGVPIGFSLTYKGSCVTLKLSYDRTIYSDSEDSQSFNASLRFLFS